MFHTSKLLLASCLSPDTPAPPHESALQPDRHTWPPTGSEPAGQLSSAAWGAWHVLTSLRHPAPSPGWHSLPGAERPFSPHPLPTHARPPWPTVCPAPDENAAPLRPPFEGRGWAFECPQPSGTRHKAWCTVGPRHHATR